MKTSFDVLCKDLFPDPPEEKVPCKGKVYRGKINNFINANSEVILQQRMIPMKRKSCPGCENCYPLEEELHERINDFDYMAPIFPEKIKHGQLYKLKVTGVGRDWETGIVDEWDLEFVEVDD